MQYRGDMSEDDGTKGIFGRGGSTEEEEVEDEEEEELSAMAIGTNSKLRLGKRFEAARMCARIDDYNCISATEPTICSPI